MAEEIQDESTALQGFDSAMREVESSSPSSALKIQNPKILLSNSTASSIVMAIGGGTIFINSTSRGPVAPRKLARSSGWITSRRVHTFLKPGIYRHHRQVRRTGSAGMIANLELAVALLAITHHPARTVLAEVLIAIQTRALLVTKGYRTRFFANI